MTNNIVLGIEIAKLRAELAALASDRAYAVEGGNLGLLPTIEHFRVRASARLSYLLFGNLGGF